jgi:DUF1365 family protein
MRSHLLEGTVRHRRARPFVYALEHGVFYLALDLEELDLVARTLRLIGRNRRNVLSSTTETISTRRRMMCARTSGPTSERRASIRRVGA